MLLKFVFNVERRKKNSFQSENYIVFDHHMFNAYSHIFQNEEGRRCNYCIPKVVKNDDHIVSFAYHHMSVIWTNFIDSHDKNIFFFAKKFVIYRSILHCSLVFL